MVGKTVKGGNKKVILNKSQERNSYQNFTAGLSFFVRHTSVNILMSSSQLLIFGINGSEGKKNS